MLVKLGQKLLQIVAKGAKIFFEKALTIHSKTIKVNDFDIPTTGLESIVCDENGKLYYDYHPESDLIGDHIIEQE